ncbi:MAG TPA: hypothetical protein VFK30_00295, partial [Anaerolineae bacterium]|nr:hypothetical protein [Anaerolineae bacterium]
MLSPNTATAAATTYQDCPNCHRSIPVDPRYPIWCDNCGWNLKPETADSPQNVFEAMYAKLGEKASQQLFDELVKAKSVRRSFKPAIALAYVLATAIHLLVIALAAFGVFLILKNWPNIWLALIGVALIAIAWFFRPRWGKLNQPILPRIEYPGLYKLADDAAQAIGSPKLAGIAVSADYNAAFSQVGWRRDRIVILGIPLFDVLDRLERVALLGHELAHG